MTLIAQLILVRILKFNIFSKCKGHPCFRWREVKEEEEENVIIPAPVDQDKSEVEAVDTLPSDHAVETVQTDKPTTGPSAGDNGIIIPKAKSPQSETHSDVSVTS